MRTQELLAARLRVIARATPWCLQALHAVEQLGLPHCCIGAGAVRNLVWDAFHGYAARWPRVTILAWVGVV
ncbi:nucleotidyltransferase family protein [Janthinobacterium sp. JC611]|uniref:nucleotidyltransferase family protein n=1 Tax=Janthinobacterium sp. JC611 TaxID=2816201 RepID=UPI001BFDD069|nr:nucleotidyltransferase family protein [Janthinobacterium sp. JC611]